MGAHPVADNAKVLDLGELAGRVSALREQGKHVVQSHGIFDLVHIGHIRHFESARELGDILVVTVVPDEHVERGPGRPVFPLDLRLEAVAALQCVDFVAASPGASAVDAIETLRPDIYARGPDYLAIDPDGTGADDPEAQAVRGVGGEFRVTNDISFSASGVINRHLSVLSEETREYLQAFHGRHGIDSLTGWLDKVTDLKVLVVGDAIIDDYRYVDAIGKSSKEPVIATRMVSSERFAGGILAVANNVANFAGSVDVLTVVGGDGDGEEFVRAGLNDAVGAMLITRPGAPTIVKRRYIDGYSLAKLFEVYEIDDSPLPPTHARELLRTLEARLPDYDAVIVVDFGHGMIGPEAIELLSHRSPFLALNVQSNAGNLGYHTLSTYPRADFVSTAENEVRLETRDRHGDLRAMISEVAGRLSAPQMVVTRGKYGCLCYGAAEDTFEIPALASEVVDRVGAGDAFISVSALVAAAGAPIEVAGFIGSAASAQAVATVGHRTSVSRPVLLRHIDTLLK